MATLFANAGPEYDESFYKGPPADRLLRYYEYSVGKTIIITGGVATIVTVPTTTVITASDDLDAGGTSSVPGKAVWSYGRQGAGFTISAAESSAIQAATGYDASWIT
jgi:hypothetical protein